MPNFSIIIPCFNDGRYAIDAIESCLRQTHASFEIIFIDDGSTDDSFDVVSRRYSTDNRIRCFVKKNGGLSSARNFGLQKSIGEYILLLDSDDLITDNYLQHADRLIKANGNCHDFVFVMPFSYFPLTNSSRAEMFRKFSPPLLGGGKFLNLFKLSLMNCFPVSAAIFPRKIIEDHISFDENLNCCEDWDFWIRIAKLLSGFIYAKCDIDASTSIRIRDGISSDTIKMDACRIQVFKKHFAKTIFIIFLFPFFGDFLKKIIIVSLRFLRNKRNNPNMTNLDLR